MNLERAPGYWPTRIMLGIAVIVVGIELLLAPVLLWPGYMAPMFDSRVAFFGVPLDVALYAVSLGMSLAGLARMVHVYRGPRDEPPPWGYRAR